MMNDTLTETPSVPAESGSPVEGSGGDAMEPIRALDPAFQSFDDLQSMPEAGAFNRLVLKGNTLADAFRLARFDALSARRAAETAKNSHTRNRAHLSATAVGGRAEAMIPPDTLEMYRQVCPGLSDDQYRAHYRRARGAASP